MTLPADWTDLDEVYTWMKDLPSEVTGTLAAAMVKMCDDTDRYFEFMAIVDPEEYGNLEEDE